MLVGRVGGSLWEEEEEEVGGEGGGRYVGIEGFV
jgi:hypothetical protein